MDHRNTPPRRLAAVAAPAACAVLGALVSLAAAVAVAAQPQADGRVAAVFPPWWSDDRIIGAAASAGDIAAAGGVSFVVILRGDPAELSRRAREAGALVLLDPALAGLCAGLSTPPKARKEPA